MHSTARSPEQQPSKTTTQYMRTPSLRHNIVPPPVGFIGREAALQELAANFGRGVLITSATGSLGSGMTALARRLAAELADDFPDGSLEIDLRGGMPGLMEPLDTAEAQRRLLRPFHLGTSLPEDPKALHQFYRETFADNKVLLLLDNAAGPAQLRYLMPRRPSAAIVTARVEFPVLAKLYPFSLHGLQADEARVLLTSIAPQCANLPRQMIGKIVKRFGESPLALRIAAALLREPFAWAPRELLTNYDVAHKRLAALRAQDTSLDVTVALELIYEALPQDLRACFEALAVFPAPFTKTAAATVWNVDLNVADDLLVTFVRSNLVMYYPDLDTYALHDTVGLYAQELLLGQPQRARTVVARFANYALTEAGFANEYYRAGGIYAEEGLLRYVAIWPHLWTAWLRMSEADPGWVRPDKAEQWLCEFPTRTQALLDLMLPSAERLKVLERALEAAQEQDRSAEATILGSLGRLYAARGDIHTALRYHEQHLQIATELHDRQGEAEAQMHIGTARGALGDVKSAQESWQHALALFMMVDDPRAVQVRAWLKALDARLGEH